MVGASVTVADIANLDVFYRVLPVIGDKAWAERFPNINKYLASLKTLPGA